MATTKDRRKYRPPFDPGREFIVTRDMSVDGKRLASGTPFDKSTVTVRRLRQLYDHRWIHFSEDKDAPSPKKKEVTLAIGPRDAEFDRLSPEEQAVAMGIRKKKLVRRRVTTKVRRKPLKESAVA